jgi:hypothetical protein
MTTHKEGHMVYYSVHKAAIARRDNLIAKYVDSQQFMAESLNRQHDNFTGWLRWQIEKRSTRLDTINLIGMSGGDALTAEAARTAGEAAAFQAVLAYVNNGWKAE